MPADPHEAPLTEAQRAELRAILAEAERLAFTPAWTREAFERLKARATAVTPDFSNWRWLYTFADRAWLTPIDL